jgi:hypothetical protein
VLRELPLNVEALDHEFRSIIRPALRFAFGSGIVIGEIHVTDGMAHLREFPAELHLKRMPAKIINKDAHRP